MELKKQTSFAPLYVCFTLRWMFLGVTKHPDFKAKLPSSGSWAKGWNTDLKHTNFLKDWTELCTVSGVWSPTKKKGFSDYFAFFDAAVTESSSTAECLLVVLLLQLLLSSRVFDAAKLREKWVRDSVSARSRSGPLLVQPQPNSCPGWLWSRLSATWRT